MISRRCNCFLIITLLKGNDMADVFISYSYKNSSLNASTKNWKPETVSLGSTGRTYLPLQNGWMKSMPVFKQQILSSLLSALIQ